MKPTYAILTSSIFFLFVQHSVLFHKFKSVSTSVAHSVQPTTFSLVIDRKRTFSVGLGSAFVWRFLATGYSRAITPGTTSRPTASRCLF